jgi:pimeloyl-ACP methyl ester carboxylesterase
VEKFQSWTENRGAIEDAVSSDDLLSNIMLYWATGAIGSSFWPYYARMHSPGLIPDGEKTFPKEILHPPRSLAERVYGNIQRWTKMEKGGHFAALEQPELLAKEIREFFRPLR